MVRKNSSLAIRGESSRIHSPRKLVVLKQLKNYKRCKNDVNYGYRWMTAAAETAFSSIKRMFGKYVSTRKFPKMVKEMLLKASLYNNMFISEIIIIV